MKPPWTSVICSVFLHGLLAWGLLGARAAAPKRVVPPIQVRVVHRSEVALNKKKPIPAPTLAKAAPAPLPLKRNDRQVKSLQPVSTRVEPMQALAAVKAPSAAPKTASSAEVGPLTQQPGSSQRPTNAVTAEAGVKAAESYLGTLRARIDELKEYPGVAKQRRQEGRVEIGFTIHKSGDIGDAHLVTPCPFEALNQAALAAVQGVAKYQPIPDRFARDEWPIVVTVVFELSNLSH